MSRLGDRIRAAKKHRDRFAGSAFMGLGEFCQMFGITRTTAWRWHVSGYGPRRIPGLNRTGAVVRYQRAAVEKWIAKDRKIAKGRAQG